MQTIQVHLSQKQNIFSEFFSECFESILSFELFPQKLTLIAYVFPKFSAPKDVLR